ncbi:hypothetical protein [Chryseobacterium sp.]|uniref:hypothetical protein n=1 Tax=Chryseobacterium sp. TaxID=1871047 RepID=UPI0028A15214|nr:hypothetical protein [Chryseobacterium sp.]
MKKTLLICFCVLGFSVSAQSFTDKNLQQSVLQINTAKTASDYEALFKKFSESKTIERWQAYYYAAVSMYLKTESSIKKGNNSSLAGSNALADKFAMGALGTQHSNDEIEILLGLIHLQKVALNTSTNVQKDVKAASDYISKLESTSSNNPRLSILKARMAQQANNTTEAENFYQKASNEFSVATSSNTFPTWGSQLIKSKN